MSTRRKGCMITVFIVMAVIAIAAVIGFKVISKKLASFSDIDFSILNLSEVEDGTYAGSADGGIVKASVEVTVKDHRISSIRIVRHDNGRGKPAEAIVQRIIEQNSLEVDVVSGATHSSNIIRAAVLDALTR